MVVDLMLFVSSAGLGFRASHLYRKALYNCTNTLSPQQVKFEMSIRYLVLVSDSQIEGQMDAYNVTCNTSYSDT